MTYFGRLTFDTHICNLYPLNWHIPTKNVLQLPKHDAENPTGKIK